MRPYLLSRSSYYLFTIANEQIETNTISLYFVFFFPYNMSMNFFDRIS